jgi:hypothetical protein
MNVFPIELHCNNILKFEHIYLEKVLSSFREQIYNHMISRKDENEYFAIDVFEHQFLKQYPNTIQKMTKTIIQELESIGWKCKLSFGDTGLFIYSTEKPPRSCW